MEAYHKLRKNKSFQQLERKLLKIDGIKVVPMPDNSINTIVSKGKLFNNKSILKLGEPCNCHGNVGWQYLNKRLEGFKICTGYALTKDDGFWRQHSWGLLNNQIIETTIKREKYFGIVIEDPLLSVVWTFDNIQYAYGHKLTNKFLDNLSKKDMPLVQLLDDMIYARAKKNNN